MRVSKESLHKIAGAVKLIFRNIGRERELFQLLNVPPVNTIVFDGSLKECYFFMAGMRWYMENKKLPEKRDFFPDKDKKVFPFTVNGIAGQGDQVDFRFFFKGIGYEISKSN